MPTFGVWALEREGRKHAKTKRIKAHKTKFFGCAYLVIFSPPRATVYLNAALLAHAPPNVLVFSMMSVSTLRNGLFASGLLVCSGLLLVNAGHENPAALYQAKNGEVIVKNPSKPKQPIVHRAMPVTFQNNNQTYSTLFLSPPTGQFIHQPVPSQNDIAFSSRVDNWAEWLSAALWGAVSILLGSCLLAAVGASNSLFGMMY